ncbi:MAG: hypothetical protein H6835_07110 [Planctomycetes bacterium]|nr:hypothetical protein [Planctomycetota bacterium]
MRSLPPWCDAALAALAVAGLAAAQSPTFSTALFPGDGVQRYEGAEWLCVRVVDVMTGAPLPGAEVALVAESGHPVRGEFSALQRATADADGFVRLPNGAPADGRLHGWMLARAPGHGQRMEMGYLGDVVALAPAIDLPLEIVDRFEEPVADCLIGMCCGCGHTPDIAWARTDAKGQCTLRGVDDRQGIRDLYLEHPRLGLLYDDRQWFPGEPPVHVVAPYGNCSQGVVVDENGKPVAGAFVGYLEVHRGPWTRTAADGSFRLCGTDDVPTVLYVDVPGADGAQRRIEVALNDQVPLRLQLPPAPPPDVSRRPGWIEFVELQEGERPRRDVPPGSQPWPPESGAVANAPAVTVRTVDLPADEHVTLVTATAEHDLDDYVKSGAPVPLPDEPFAFVLGSAYGPHRTFRYTRQQALAEGIVRLRWFRPTRIEGRVIGPDGAPRDVELKLLTPAEALTVPDLPGRDGAPCPGAIALETDREGLAVLQVTDGIGTLPTRLLTFLLPPRGDDVVVDVGTVELSERPQFLLRDVDGEELVDWQVALLRRGFVDAEQVGHVRLRRAGHTPTLELQPGDVLHVEPVEEQPQLEDGKAIYRVPARFAIDGDGPWDFTLPAGELWLRARCDDAPTAAIVLFVDDLRIELKEPLLLRGLTVGRHRLFVCAKGHQTAIVDVDVPAVGMAELDLVLPPR